MTKKEKQVLIAGLKKLATDVADLATVLEGAQAPEGLGGGFDGGGGGFDGGRLGGGGLLRALAAGLREQRDGGDAGEEGNLLDHGWLYPLLLSFSRNGVGGGILGDFRLARKRLVRIGARGGDCGGGGGCARIRAP